jgi:uncharacterized membrane protein YqjE
MAAPLRSLAATLIALACARVELIAVELQEETARARRTVTLVVSAALFLGMGLLLAAFLVVLLLWDTHRLLAAGGVTLLYLGIGAWALAKLRELDRNRPAPFAATMGEFANDLKLLRAGDE